MQWISTCYEQPKKEPAVMLQEHRVRIIDFSEHGTLFLYVEAFGLGVIV